MISHGVHPIKRRKGQASTRTFGATTVDYTPFNYDAGFGMPDQNSDGESESCSIYTQTEIRQDKDKRKYKKPFTKEKVVMLSGQANGPYDIDYSITAVMDYGVQAENETTDAEAETHKPGRPFWLEKNPGMDWYDSLISVMKMTGESFSIIGPWFPEFENIGSDGKLPATFSLVWGNNPGHDHKIGGLNNWGFLPDKSWQGVNYGDHGWCYWSRESFNRYMSIPGTGAFTFVEYDGSIQTIQWGIIYNLKAQIDLWLRKLGLR